MILQYNTMFSERKRSLLIDNTNGLIEHAAALLVKVGLLCSRSSMRDSSAWQAYCAKQLSSTCAATPPPVVLPQQHSTSAELDSQQFGRQGGSMHGQQSSHSPALLCGAQAAGI
jgi:hypothetical protein